MPPNLKEVPDSLEECHLTHYRKDISKTRMIGFPTGKELDHLTYSHEDLSKTRMIGFPTNKE